MLTVCIVTNYRVHEIIKYALKVLNDKEYIYIFFL